MAEVLDQVRGDSLGLDQGLPPVLDRNVGSGKATSLADPGRPSSVDTRTNVRLRHGVPSTNVSIALSLIYATTSGTASPAAGSVEPTASGAYRASRPRPISARRTRSTPSAVATVAR